MNLELEELTGKIIECAITVHKKSGSGFLESGYQLYLPIELKKQGLKVEAQKVGLLLNFSKSVLKIKRGVK